MTLVKSESLDSIVVGIDDTDMPGVGGTGRLARRVAHQIEIEGLGRAHGVTRHQLYEGPGVPKTSRNSAAAVRLSTDLASSELRKAIAQIVERESITGSDPGLALLTGPVPETALRFAQRAQQGLVTQVEARHLAEAARIALVGLGGSEDGVIGALCGAVLRAEGNDGRFVELLGIREVSGSVTVDDLLARTGIAAVIDLEHGEELEGEVRLDVGTWVRPRVIGGRPVMVARRVEGTWVNADARP